MAKSIFQKAYDWFKNITTPVWLKEFFDTLQEMLIKALTQIGEEVMTAIEAKIIEVNDKPITGREKLQEVFNYSKTVLNLTTLSNSLLNMLIEILVNRLKVSGIIS